MKMALITLGLPGAGYHGGAVTCWAIVKQMLANGHDVTVLSLFDNFESNPYLASRDEQTAALKGIGAGVEFVDFNYKELVSTNYSRSKLGIVSKPVKWLGTLVDPQVKRFFPWANLASKVENKLSMIQPDAIFCYHFDVLSAVYKTRIAPIMAGVGDLWHLPGYFRWKDKGFSVKKYLIEGPRQLGTAVVSKRLMLEMLSPCNRRGAFAAHYAEWFRKQNGFSDTLYLRTPAHDPVGDLWKEIKETEEPEIPRVLIVGDLGTTSTSFGLQCLANSILPDLERNFGKDGFEIHLIGGGRLPHELSLKLNHPAIKLRGRVVPAEPEFLRANVLLVPTPITLGIRVRIVVGFSMACCVVAHSANAAGIPELKNGQNCLLAESGETLAKHVNCALKNRELQKRLGENGRKTYEKYFSEGVAASRIVRKMEEIGAFTEGKSEK